MIINFPDAADFSFVYIFTCFYFIIVCFFGSEKIQREFENYLKNYIKNSDLKLRFVWFILFGLTQNLTVLCALCFHSQLCPLFYNNFHLLFFLVRFLEQHDVRDLSNF